MTFISAQVVGGPEICQMSIREATIGTQPKIFIIGKNFIRGIRVVFRQFADSSASSNASNTSLVALDTPRKEDIIWQRDAEIDPNYFYQAQATIC